MTAVDIGEQAIVFNRLIEEERFLGYLYDDATDLPVKAPVGNATIAYGFNVQAGCSLWLGQRILKLQIEEVCLSVYELDWYAPLNAARRSVILDIAFNGGYGDLFGYPKMIAAIKAEDWAEAAKQCTSSNPSLAGRYEKLAQILLTGEIAS